MPRRISNGVTGRNVLGAYFSSGNIFSTVVADGSIELSPRGTGETIVNSNVRLDGQSSLIFNDNAGDNQVSIRSQEMTSDYTLTLPPDTGQAGFVLTVDGAGNLTFESVAVSVEDQTADTNTYYPTLVTTTSGQITNVSVSSSKLSYQPSTGTLTANTVSTSNLQDSSGRTLTIVNSSGTTVWGG